MRQVFFLLSANAVNAAEKSVRKDEAAAPQHIGGSPTVKIVDKDAGIDFSEQEQVSRRNIAAYYKKTKGKNHWEVLGLRKRPVTRTLKKRISNSLRYFIPMHLPDKT